MSADRDAPALATRTVLPWAKTPAVRKEKRGTKRRIEIGFVGTGNYASSMLLPHLAKLSAASLAHVATTRSLSAANAQRKSGFTTASTDADSVFEDGSLDSIFIVTRHATHAGLVRRALETGKAVFVEKPLALTYEETDQISKVVEKTGNDRLKKDFGAASTSETRYLVNAGPLAKDSWYLNEEVYAVRGPEKGDVQGTFRFAIGATGTIAVGESLLSCRPERVCG